MEKFASYKIGLLLIGLTLSSSSCQMRRCEALETFTFSRELIYPIKEGETKHLNGSITYNEEEVLNDIQVFAKLYHFKNDTPYQYAQITASQYYNGIHRGDSIIYDFDVSESAYYAKYKILIKLSIYNMEDIELLDSRDLYLYVENSEDINPDDYRSSPLVKDSLTYQDGSIFREEYLFDGIKNVYNLPYYYRLDASIFSFNYLSDIPFTIENAYLSFIDKDNLFPHIISFEGKKILPLRYEEVDGVVAFYFSNLFINKDSLDMSSVNREGYLRTSFLYFPRNHIEQIQGYTFEINLVNMGANGIAVHHEVMLNTSKPLLGPCNKAVYCVIGGVA